MRIRYIIADKYNQWEEELKVENKETAEKDIKTILNRFNSALRGNETNRRLIKILSPKKVKDNTIGEIFGDIELLLRDLRHENCNAFGNAWLKENFMKIIKAYNKMIETGKSQSFKNILKKVFDNVKDIQEYDELKYLCDYDFDAKLKEGDKK